MFLSILLNILNLNNPNMLAFTIFTKCLIQKFLNYTDGLFDIRYFGKIISRRF